jgi:NAD(P)-dependent dehydrogenase (short-subunit alcohol dehydrogenase family)
MGIKMRTKFIGGFQMDKLKGKVIIVTGAASGIGRGAALRFAKDGAKLGLLDIDKTGLEEVLEEVTDLGGEGIAVKTDVADAVHVEDAFHEVVQHFGQLDVVFANAGINGTKAPIENITPDEWCDTMKTNLDGTFYSVKYAIPHMKENGGSIIITSSINGNRSFSGFGFAAYSSTKAAQMAFGKMAALELSKYKIRVNIVCPGAIDTDIEERTYPKEDALKKIKIPAQYERPFPLEDKPGTPEQVAELVYFLASDLSSHITGTEVYIDGAETLLKG